jgi:hypothetical protein
MKSKGNLFQIWLLGVMFLMPSAVRAQFTFTTNNNAITITGSTGSGLTGALIIPDTLNGYPVTSVGSQAFEFDHLLTSISFGSNLTNIGNAAFFATGLTNLTIPNSVVSIGQEAFADCTSLTNVTIGANLTFIDDEIFQDCTGLASVSIPHGVTYIGNSAFLDCTNLRGIMLPDTVTSIGNAAFYNCLSLTNVVIPDQVYYIGNQTFAYCLALTNLVLDANLTTLGGAAFKFCQNLRNLRIPQSLTKIGVSAFMDCTNLDLTIDAGNPVYTVLSGALIDKSQNTLLEYSAGKPGGYEIPVGIVNIALSAFQDCALLTDVTIPNSVTNIGVFAFTDCLSLTNVTIGNQVTTIGSAAFYNCQNLATVSFTDNAPADSTDGTVFGMFSTSGYLPFATVYYLPGTTGWGPTFDGIPTVAWLPQVQTAGLGIGASTNQFKFDINWARGQTVVVEACTNLIHPDWQPVQTNVLTTGSANFSDPQWSSYPGRFYRVRSL